MFRILKSTLVLFALLTSIFTLIGLWAAYIEAAINRNDPFLLVAPAAMTLVFSVIVAVAEANSEKPYDGDDRRKHRPRSKAVSGDEPTPPAY